MFGRHLTHLRTESILGREVDFYHDRKRSLIIMKGRGLRLSREIAPHASAAAACAAHIAEIRTAAAERFGGQP